MKVLFTVGAYQKKKKQSTFYAIIKKGKNKEVFYDVKKFSNKKL